MFSPSNLTYLDYNFITIIVRLSFRYWTSTCSWTYVAREFVFPRPTWGFSPWCDKRVTWHTGRPFPHSETSDRSRYHQLHKGTRLKPGRDPRSCPVEEIMLQAFLPDTISRVNRHAIIYMRLSNLATRPSLCQRPKSGGWRAGEICHFEGTATLGAHRAQHVVSIIVILKLFLFFKSKGWTTVLDEATKQQLKSHLLF